MANAPIPFAGNARGAAHERGARSRVALALLVRRLAAAALPRTCLLCGLSCGTMPQGPICRVCDAAYWNEARLRCEVCALPLPGLRARRFGAARFRCAACIRTPPPFDATLALADYRPPLERLALGLKFHARLAVAHEFGKRLARLADDRLGGGGQQPDILAPMPLAHARLVERGYNQAWEIARPLARALGVGAEATLMRRIADTAPQSRLDRDARRRNVATAFRVMRPVGGLHVGLVDDVMTSGATLEAAARALKTAGARRVTHFVALRTPQD
ncbi:amidophosphoribosyltransferase [Trinickia dabaoshanensis]|uniref:Amidophosphoribosyltransferase n=1 Tax=Trinickia dabaoshanensis TaxID=564714 RepID=A0A2N7VVV3_9BURK|nr:ComF family protein [Trinickia dabaoshanensis]PMS21287.1 amidophosphoribosyltransferase [Trinickia dabaoshanensis]